MKKDIEWNVPLLALFLLLAMLAKWVLVLIDSEFLVLVILDYIVVFAGFSLCLFIVVLSCYYSYKIGTGKCLICHKKLEKRIKRVIVFLLTPPWRKRKVEFICLSCKKKI